MHTKHTTIYALIKNNPKNMTECDKPNSHISSKLHMIYISSDNVRHPVTESKVINIYHLPKCRMLVVSS